MKRWLALGALLVVLGAGASESDTPSQQARLVTWGDWGAFVGRDLPGQGIASQIAREAFSDIRKDIPIDFHPWPRAYKMALEGQYLAAFPYAKSGKRVEDFHFSDSLFTTTIRLFAPRQRPTQIEEARQFESPRVCIPKGYNTAVANDWFPQESLVLERPSQMKNCMLMLARGRVDFVLASEDVGWHVIHNDPDLHLRDFRQLPPAQERSVHIIVSRRLANAEAIIERVNARLAEMRDNGRIRKLFREYDRYPGR